MILFCEDCGEKNVLETKQVKEGKAIFICRICDYSNSYRIETTKKTFPKRAMAGKKELLLLEIEPFPDLIGSFFFHVKTGVIKSNMPDLLKKSDLEILGKVLVKNYRLSINQYHDINEITLTIANKNMILKKVNSDLFYIMACKTFPLSKDLLDKLDLLIKDSFTKSGYTNP